MNLAVTATLYATFAIFLSLVFAMVNYAFPDALAYGYFGSGARFATATLIIVFPLFVWLSRLITKSFARDAALRESPIRRWFVYITLFLASATLVTDLIVLLNTFLSGEITARFILKVAAVLVVAGLVFWHYLSEVRGTASAAKYNAAVYSSSALVLIALVMSFVVFGSPATMRKQRADQTRVNDLQSIQWQVVSHWQQKGELPNDLSGLEDSISGYVAPTDPETGAAYEYSATSDLSFTLCADFETKSTADVRGRGGFSSIYPPLDMNDNWKHDAGRVCFDRTIDPERYPVFEKPVSRF